MLGIIKTFAKAYNNPNGVEGRLMELQKEYEKVCDENRDFRRQIKSLENHLKYTPDMSDMIKYTLRNIPNITWRTRKK